MIRVSPRRTLHYGWIIVCTGFLVLFSCFGLARYAFTMLLPGMQAGLGLTYDRMGFIGTANFIGYLSAVLLAPWVMRRLRPRMTIFLGLLVIGLCLVAISRCRSFASITALYLVVGAGGGFANIPLMALITYWFRSEQRGRAAGLAIGGSGAAIIFAGFAVPLLERWCGADGWRTGWLAIGVISLAVAGLAGLLLRNDPGEMGLEPVGSPPHVAAEELVPHRSRRDSRILLSLGLLYLVFGATFMVYGTFIVTTMVKEYGFSREKAGLYWSWVGLFSMFSGVGFGALSDLIGRKRGLTVVFLVQTAAYLLAGLRLGGIALAVSIVLYGSAVFAIPAIMAAAVGDYLGMARAATSFAAVTLFFAFGQTIGPAGAGIIAAATGGFTPAYICAAALTAAAALFAATLPHPPGR